MLPLERAARATRSHASARCSVAVSYTHLDVYKRQQEDSPTQKMFFQLIHAMHLAGRCTGCGECNRACPMGIPVGALKLQMGRVVKKLFEYAPGMDVDAVPPLLGFQLEEKNIHEHHIEGA